MTSPDRVRHHRLRRMTGRDPHESHRVATPLELLYDLTVVAAFSLAGNQAAHLVAEGHIGAAAGAFGFVMFAVCWAWINFSWFASAFDTDDWLFRVMTMVQMAGVVILALGLPPVFSSIDHEQPLDNGVVVAGYIVMRVALLAQWIRVARQSPEYRRTAIAMIATIAVAQVGWTVLVFLELPAPALVPAFVVLYLIELGGPIFAERGRREVPWHAHHLAERFGLLLIITIGEVILGTVAAVAALIDRTGWSVDAIAVIFAGVGLAFGLWWIYFAVPAGDILHRHRGRAKPWAYSHIVLFASVAAMGVGLHATAYLVEGEAHIDAFGAVLSVAVPVLVFAIGYFAVYSYLVHAFDPFHLLLFAGAVVVLALAVGLAAAGASLAICLVIVMLAPGVVVVGYETVGHRHMAAVLDRTLA